MNPKHFLLCLVCVLFCLAACSQKKAEDEEEGDQASQATVEVQTIVVEQGPIRQITSVTGTLTALPDRDVKISALMPGRIDQVAVTEGDPVQKGQMVARLDETILRDQLTQAKAALENARANEERMSRLFDRGIAAGKEKEDAHKDFVTAQAAYDSAATQVQRARIISPIEGFVVKRFHGAGEQADGTGADPILEIADFDPIELAAALPTAYLASVREGQSAEIRTDAFHGQVFKGSVIAILPAVDPGTGSATVRIRIPNSQHHLKGGMFASAGILTDTHESALYVPAAAVTTANNEPKVFVVGSDSHAHERAVQVGWHDGDKVEILKGVQKGEAVVTTGSYGLADGMALIVKKRE